MFKSFFLKNNHIRFLKKFRFPIKLKKLCLVLGIYAVPFYKKKKYWMRKTIHINHYILNINNYIKKINIKLKVTDSFFSDLIELNKYIGNINEFVENINLKFQYINESIKVINEHTKDLNQFIFDLNFYIYQLLRFHNEDLIIDSNKWDWNQLIILLNYRRNFLNFQLTNLVYRFFFLI